MWGTGLKRRSTTAACGRSHQNKTQVAAALTHYADDFMGSHDFKFGGQFLRSLDKTTMEYNSGVFYYDYSGEYNYYDYVGNRLLRGVPRSGRLSRQRRHRLVLRQ